MRSITYASNDGEKCKTQSLLQLSAPHSSCSSVSAMLLLLLLLSVLLLLDYQEAWGWADAFGITYAVKHASLLRQQHPALPPPRN